MNKYTLLLAVSLLVLSQAWAEDSTFVVDTYRVALPTKDIKNAPFVVSSHLAAPEEKINRDQYEEVLKSIPIFGLIMEKDPMRRSVLFGDAVLHINDKVPASLTGGNYDVHVSNIEAGKITFSVPDDTKKIATTDETAEGASQPVPAAPEKKYRDFEVEIHLRADPAEGKSTYAPQTTQSPTQPKSKRDMLK